MAQQQAGVGARVLLNGAFECRDAEGNVVKTITFSGSVPLADIEAALEQQQTQPQQEKADGQ